MSQARVRPTVAGLLAVCVFPLTTLTATPAVAAPTRHAGHVVIGSCRAGAANCASTAVPHVAGAPRSEGGDNSNAAEAGDQTPRPVTPTDADERDSRLARTGPGASPFGEAAVALALCVLGAVTLYRRHASRSKETTQR